MQVLICPHRTLAGFISTSFPSFSLISAFNYGFPCRYFTSVPLPTKPDLLPRPARKGEPINSKVSDFNPEEGPTVLSPPRKSRRVMPQREGFEGNNAYRVDKVDGHVNQIRQSSGENTSHKEQVPMSIDFSVFQSSRPPPRPTINR